MSDRCKRCGACKECGAVNPPYYTQPPFYPYPWRLVPQTQPYGPNTSQPQPYTQTWNFC